MNRYLALTFDVPAELCELAASLLHDAQAQGVEIRDQEVLPPPGMQPVPVGRAVAIGFFGEDEADEATLAWIREELEAQAGGQEIRVGLERLDEENWSETWKLHFKPLHVGDRLWILPPWEPRPQGSIAVVIEPGMAFGTGGHATTSLCLEGVLEVLDRRPGAAVVDVGCGSGILGIAAAKLGAGRVVMIDNDPVAVAVAKENADANGVPAIETSDRPVEDLGQRFELVIANILAGTLVELADPIAAAVAAGGELLLSGILVDQVEGVRRAYEERELRLRGIRRQGEWAMIWMERAG